VVRARHVDDVDLARGGAAPGQQVVGERHDPVEVVLGPDQQQWDMRARCRRDAVDEAEEGEVRVADRGVRAGDGDDAFGHGVGERAHQVAPGREEPQSDPVAVHAAVGAEVRQRRLHVVACPDQGLLGHEAVLDHPRDQAHSSQQRAVRAEGRPLPRPDRPVGRIGPPGTISTAAAGRPSEVPSGR
jgi:hypothetical protein